MNITIPNEFKKICRNMGPDITDFVSSIDDLVSHALIGIEKSDASVIVPFLSGILDGSKTHEELKDFWWSSPVTFVFYDGQDVANFLTRVRDALLRPPYA